MLRNMSRGKGIGFFEAGNFYPDFILWLVVGEHQNVAFIDPKGIRNLEGLTDSKIEFYRTIKEIERRLGEPSVTLSSFIVSNTPYDEVAFWGNKSDLEERNVLFQREDRQTYVKKMLDNMFAANADVNAMWERYGQYLGGREPLMSMANYCLTRLEETTATQRQKRKSAADTYHIDMRVLSKLGDLTANVGDHLGARKAANQGKSRLPTAQEIAWVEAAVKRVIHRAAEYAADPQKQWPQITMDNFPAI